MSSTSNRRVSRLGLDQQFVELLEKQNLNTCKDILCMTKMELMNVLGVSEKKQRKLIQVVSKACAPAARTAYDMFKERNCSPTGGFFPTSLSLLDAVLQGGIPTGSITEIAGPPSVGKTQFCLMLSVLATLPTSLGGLDGSVIYVDTESAFSAERLKEIAETRVPEIYCSESELFRLMSSVHVYQAATSKALKEIAQKLEWDIIRRKVKLVIIDSVASLMRKEFGSGGLLSITERNQILIELSAILKNIAETFGVVVFVTNQVTTRFASPGVTLDLEDDETDRDEAVDCWDGANDRDSSGSIVPALGLTWAHCVNTRLVAQFVDAIRQLLVSKSPLAPNVAVQFQVDQCGIVPTDNVISETTSTDPCLQTVRTKNEFL